MCHDMGISDRCTIQWGKKKTLTPNVCVPYSSGIEEGGKSGVIEKEKYNQVRSMTPRCLFLRVPFLNVYLGQLINPIR